MILLPDLDETAKALEQLRQRGTVREVRAKGTEQDEAELREWQRDVQQRSRARRRNQA